MIRLDTTTRKLQAVLAGAIATNQLPIVAAWSDATATTYTGGATVINTNSTTAVDIVAAPGASTVRDVDFINIRNADTASATVTLRFNDNGTLYGIVTAVLAVGDTLNYTHASGCKVLDANGAVKFSFGAVNLTSQVTGTLPVANGGTGVTSATTNAVLLGNGTSAFQVVAPSTTGNVLTSNGATWQSAAAAGTSNLATEQATTSGTSKDFTGLPAGIKQLIILPVGMGTNGSSDLQIQLGYSGGVETTGYLGGYCAFSSGGNAPANLTTGFGIYINTSSDVLHGAVILTLEDAAQFTWTALGITADSNAAISCLTAGSKSLTGELDRIRITTVNGTDAFARGAVNLMYRS